MRTAEQLRAASALARVQQIAGDSNDTDKEMAKRYRSYVERLGPAILMNGLGQALAAEQAAAGSGKIEDPDKRAHHKLYCNVNNWLCRPSGGVYPNARDLLNALIEHDESDYLRAQAEALAWLQWHKKFCRSTLPREE